MAKENEEGTLRQSNMPLLTVRHGTIGSGVSGKYLHIDSVDYELSIEGVEVGRQFADCDPDRRDLALCYNNQIPSGALGYVVAVRPGACVGNHYHHRRGEKLLLCTGRAYFRLHDRRPDSPSYERIDCFDLSVPGTTVTVPPGVAHSIIASGVTTVLFVSADLDFDPNDDVHASLAALPLDKQIGNDE